MFGIKTRLKRLQPDWLIAARRHRKIHGEFPNLIRPKTFNEKVLHRLLFDRRSLIAQLADKLAVRDYVEPRLGAQVLPRLYYVTTRPGTIPFDQLPEKFVVKPNHGSGWVRIVTDKMALNEAALRETCAGWLNQNFYEITREWAYKQIEPRIIVEQFIDDGSGKAPYDYKVYVFGGIVEMIEVDIGRFDHLKRLVYSPGWEKLPEMFDHHDMSGEVPPPPHLEQMIAAAETLGDGWDFIRVDFYDIQDQLYVGELTTTPACGLIPFRAKHFDLYLGSRWKLASG
jgi:hypothetical protein